MNDHRPPSRPRLWTLAVAAAVATAAGVALLWRDASKPAPQPPAAVPAPSGSEPTEASPPPSAPSPPEAEVQHPIETPAAMPPLAAAEISDSLTELLGRKAVLSFFQTGDFARRVVATVDNLGRSHASPMLWPVNPTAGRFTVEESDAGTVIAADNSARYTPFILLVETIDIGRAVDLYVRMYPLLQQAYRELGYPKQNFNDRLIKVIGQLLATPDIEGPVRVQLTEVKGPFPSVRPWVRYQFADPELEALAAGQKILLRVGAVNERRLKAKLAEIREELLAREAAPEATR